MFDKFKSMLKMSDKKNEPTNVMAQKSYQTFGTIPYHGSLTYDWAKGIAYDNVYPSISKIANEFVKIKPYAIDANGKPLQDVPLLNKIYHPNQQMSSTDFREALAIGTLTHRKIYLLVWHYENGKMVAGGGGITPDNVAGFTFLEDCYITKVDDKKIYKSGNLKYEYTEDDVIELYAGIDPNDLDAGYSPTQAVQKWANIDDFIANYEAGHFENGAVPAGEFIITAPTKEAFNDIVDSMQKKFRGSGNNNNVAYIHRPIASDTGQVAPAQIEWVPFALANKDMSLDTIFKQVNDKIDSTFGVPASVRGVNENKGYASVRIDQQVFMEYTVKPFATKIWTRFTHEMNRLTGGLGFAITFDLEIPNVAEEEKIDAERKKVEADTIMQMLGLGYSLDSIVDAFEFSNSYKLLKIGEQDDGEIVNDKPDVDEGDEVEDSPEIAVMKSVPTHCSHHHDEIHKEADQKTLKELRQLLTNYYQSVINETLNDSQLASKEISAIGLEQYDENGDGLIDEYEAGQIPVPEPSDEAKFKLQMAMLGILFARMLASGEKRYQDTINRFGITITIPELQNYVISDEAQKQYEKITSQIVNSFSDQITQNIRDAIDNVVKNGDGTTTAKDLAKAIRNSVKDNKWRIDRITNTEEHRADNLGQVDAVKELQKVSGREFGFKWRTTSVEPCEFCQYMNGTIVATGEAFVPLGTKLEFDGAIYLNDWDDMLTPNAHPNCQCVFDVVEL